MNFVQIVNEAKQQFDRFHPETEQEADLDAHIQQLLSNMRIAAENLQREVGKRGA